MCACERVCGEGGIGGGRIEISTIRTLVVNNTTVAIETWWLPHRLTKILLVYTMKPCTQPTQAFIVTPLTNCRRAGFVAEKICEEQGLNEGRLAEA